VRKCWPQAALAWIMPPPAQLFTGESLSLGVAAKLGGLDPGDVRAEAVLEDPDSHERSIVPFKLAGTQDGGARFELEFTPPNNGMVQLSVRLYPFNPALAHPFEMGCMLWL
jgi:starch phosphorylase